MTFLLVAFFSIVMAVNFAMAWFAVERFGGVVVENSYVASQKFNGWLEEARVEDSLGWHAAISRDTVGRIVVTTRNVPQGADIMAFLRRPIGIPDDRTVRLTQTAPHRFVSAQIEPGRWIVRLEVDAGGHHWSHEARIE